MKRKRYTVSMLDGNETALSSNSSQRGPGQPDPLGNIRPGEGPPPPLDLARDGARLSNVKAPLRIGEFGVAGRHDRSAVAQGSPQRAAALFRFSLPGGLPAVRRRCLGSAVSFSGGGSAVREESFAQLPGIVLQI
jgi:hypothetical protein